jgi:hypothetical protein
MKYSFANFSQQGNSKISSNSLRLFGHIDKIFALP